SDDARGSPTKDDRRCARLLCAGAAVGPTGKHAARRPNSVRLVVAGCDARVLCARTAQSLVLACNGGGVHRRVSLWLPSGRLALWRSRVDLGGHRVQAVAITAANVVAGLRLGSSSSTLEARADAKYTRHQSHVGGGQD